MFNHYFTLATMTAILIITTTKTTATTTTSIFITTTNTNTTSNISTTTTLVSTTIYCTIVATAVPFFTIFFHDDEYCNAWILEYANVWIYAKYTSTWWINEYEEREDQVLSFENIWSKALKESLGNTSQSRIGNFQSLAYLILWRNIIPQIVQPLRILNKLFNFSWSTPIARIWALKLILVVTMTEM